MSAVLKGEPRVLSGTQAQLPGVQGQWEPS